MSRGNRGKVLEKNILQANAYYEHEGKAVITQVPTPIKNLGSIGLGAMFKAVYEKKSTVDFMGSIKGGRAVYFDAKETKDKSFAVANETKLHAHQIHFLGQQHLLGALCFLVVDFTAEFEAYVIPWPVVARYLDEAEKGGRKSIPLADCRSKDDIFRINTQKGYLDYLEPALAGEFGIW